jgi:hypothetical protein
MPNRLVYAVAKHCKMQLDEVENIWRKSKRAAKDEGHANDYTHTVAKFINTLGVSVDALDEVSTIMSVSNVGGKLTADRKQSPRPAIGSKIKLEAGKYGLIVVAGDEKSVVTVLDEEGNPTDDVRLVLNSYLKLIQEGFMDRHKDNYDATINQLLNSEDSLDDVISGCMSREVEQSVLENGKIIKLTHKISDIFGRVNINEGDEVQIISTKGTETRVRIKGTDIVTTIHTNDLTEGEASRGQIFSKPKSDKDDKDNIEGMIDKMLGGKGDFGADKDKPKIELDDTDVAILDVAPEDEETLINLDSTEGDEEGRVEAPDATPAQVPNISDMPTELLPHVEAEVGSAAGIPIPAETANLAPEGETKPKPGEEETEVSSAPAKLSDAPDKLSSPEMEPADMKEPPAEEEKPEEEEEKPEESISRIKRLTRLAAQHLADANPGIIKPPVSEDKPKKDEETIDIDTDPAHDKLGGKKDEPPAEPKPINLTVKKGTQVNITVESAKISDPKAAAALATLPSVSVDEAVAARAKKLQSLVEKFS